MPSFDVESAECDDSVLEIDPALKDEGGIAAAVGDICSLAVVVEPVARGVPVGRGGRIPGICRGGHQPAPNT